MTERRLRRQESASSALGGSSLPRAPNVFASTNLPPTGPSGDANPLPTTGKQWEEYCAALEADHEELRELFEQQRTELAAAAALLAERKLHESQLASLEKELNQHDGFLAEVMELLTLAEGGRSATGGDGLAHRGHASTTARVDVTGSPGMRVPMDVVRDAIQKQQLRLQSLRRREEGSRAALRSLQQGTANANDPSKCTSAGKENRKGSVIKDDILVPSSAKDYEKVQRRARSLERKLQAAEKDARGLAADLKHAEHALKLKTATEQRNREELKQSRQLLEKRDAMLDAAERRCRAAERELRGAQENMTTDATGATEGESISNSTGDRRQTTTRHYRLLSGSAYAEALQVDAAAFREALIQDASVAVHVPATCITVRDVHAVGSAHSSSSRAPNAAPLDASAGVSVEFDVKHNEKLSSDAVDVLLLEAAFPSAAELAGNAALAAQSAQRQELAALRASAASQEAENAALRRRVQNLEAAVQRRDRDRATSDKDVSAAIAEAEATVRELYAALEGQRASEEALATDLAAQVAKIHALEEALAIANEKRAAAEAKAAQLSSDHSALSGQLVKLRAEHEREVVALTEGLQAANVEVGVAIFEVSNGGVPLPSELAEAAAALTAASFNNGASGALMHTLLCEAAVATGTVPVRVTACSCTLSSTLPSPSAKTAAPHRLALSIQLAYYASRENTAHVREDITSKLDSCSFTAAMELLRRHSDDARSAQTARSDLEAAEKRLAMVLSLAERRNAPTMMAKIDLLISRLRSVEGLLRESKDALADLELARQRACDAASASGETLTALQEKARRLEAALIEKQQQQKLSANTSINSEASAEASRAKEQELAARLQEREQLVQRLEREAAQGREELRRQGSRVEQLTGRVRELERCATAAAGEDGGNAAVARVAALEASLRRADEEKAALRRQVAEMETDMNDFSKMQAAMQTSLDGAQTELRAKKQDLDVLVKQLQRLEEQQRRGQEGAQRSQKSSCGDQQAMRERQDETPSTRGSRAVGSHQPNVMATLDDEAVETEAAQPNRPQGSISSLSSAAAVGSSRSIPSTARATNDGSSRGTPTAFAGLRRPPTPSSSTANGRQRIIKRSNSSAFSRTATTPVVAPRPPNASWTTTASSPAAGAAGVGSSGGGKSSRAARERTAGAAPGTVVFTRSATATTSTTSTRPRTVDAPPRLGSSNSSFAVSATGAHPIALHRQESHTYFSSAANALKNGNGAADAAALTKERRHVSPVAGSGSSSVAGGGGAGIITSRRPPTSSINALQRSQSMLGSSVMSTSFVRTPSGYRRVNPNASESFQE